MNNLHKLKIGTLLMWDASPHTYPQGAKKGQTIIYPAIVSGQDERNGMRLKTDDSNGQFIGRENEFVRLPTKNELEKLIWPSLN